MERKQELYLFGGQHPWIRDILRLLAWLHALYEAIRHSLSLPASEVPKREISLILALHGTDRPWTLGDPRVGLKRGYEPPPYRSISFEAVAPSKKFLDPVRQSLNAPFPYSWAAGPRTSATIATLQALLTGELGPGVDEWLKNELMNVWGMFDVIVYELNRWYDQLAAIAGYNFRQIPQPSEAGSILEWLKVLLKWLGIDPDLEIKINGYAVVRVVLTTISQLLADHREDIKNIPDPQNQGMWWVVDGNFMRWPWDGGELPEGMFFAPKRSELVGVLNKELGYTLYATRLPYVDDQSLYRQIVLRISEQDKKKLSEALREAYVRNKMRRGTVPPSLPEVAIPDKPDGLGFGSLGYEVFAEVELEKGKFVRVSFRRP